MDDNNDEEYNYRSNTNGRWLGFPGYYFKPDSTDMTRNGLGLEVPRSRHAMAAVPGRQTLFSGCMK